MFKTKVENLVIRKAEKNDVPLILSLIQGLAAYEKMENDCLATEEKLEDTLFNHAYANVVIAEYNGAPAGFALYFYNYSTFLAKPGIYLEDLYIKEHLRGNGIGKEIFRYLCHTAMELDCGRVEWSCLNWNEPALHFYGKLGAQPMDEWTVHRLDETHIRAVAVS